MAIIQFPQKDYSVNITDINSLIQDSIEQSAMIEDLIQEAPDILNGHCNFRDILRAIKRGNSLDQAIESYSSECCPPKTIASEECEDITCNDCWHNFIENYQNILLRKKRGESINEE